MKKTLAILLSLAMVFALFGAMTVSVSAEDVVWTVFKSADNGDTPANNGSGDTKISRINNTYSTVTSTKIWQIAMPKYQATSTKFSFEAGTLSGVTNIRLWASAPKGGFDLILVAGSTVYGCNISLTPEGKTYSFGSKTFSVYKSTEKDYGAYKTPTSTSVKFSDIDMRAVTTIQIQRRYDDNVGAKTGTLYYDKIEIAKPAASSASPITMLDGAAMRIDGATEGIRFEASVDKAAFNAAMTGVDPDSIEIGTLIAKEGTDISKVVVNNAKEVTNNSTELNGDQIPVAKYPSDVGLQEVAGTNKYIIVGSLVEIKDKNANQKYVARAYVKYKDAEGNPQVMYADALSSARSLAGVANAIKTEAGENTYYSQLCEEHKAVVDGWAAKLA